MPATLAGIIAILLWALLALLTAASGPVPPFQLTAICFAIAALIGIIKLVTGGVPSRLFRQPVAVWLLGIGGLFGYHFFYFTALRNAPPAEASLIAYLWPLLIILFSALLPGERLRTHHVAGGLLGLAGAALLLARGGGFAFDDRYALGYAAAGLCALIWSGYSVLSRRFANVPSDIVTGFCAASAMLAMLAHLAFETTQWPQSVGQWTALVMLGLGPVGVAFYVWDHGVKHGNIQLLGAASYLTPVLSVAVLVAAGYAELTWQLGAATLLVTLGAIVAAADQLRKRA